MITLRRSNFNQSPHMPRPQKPSRRRCVLRFHIYDNGDTGDKEVSMFAYRLTLALVAVAGPAPLIAQPSAQTIDVQSFSYRPAPIHLRAGQPVTLTFVNRSDSSHGFTAKSFFASATITDGAAPDGEIDLKGHETKRVTLVPHAGTYHAHCSHFMHKQMGMSTTIVVN
jgi:plastocyanin